MGAGRLEHPSSLVRREADALAEGVDRVGQPFRRHRRDHPLAHQRDIAVRVVGEFRRQAVRPEEGRADRHRPHLAERPRDPQLLQLALEIEAVAGLDLHRGHALGDQGVEAGQGGCDQLRLAGGACGAHGRDDAAAGPRDLLVARPCQPQLELAGAVAGEDQVGVAIDQPGRDPAPLAVDGLARRERRRLGAWAGIEDAPVPRRHYAVFDNPKARPIGGQGRESRLPPHPIARLAKLARVLVEKTPALGRGGLIHLERTGGTALKATRSPMPTLWFETALLPGGWAKGVRVTHAGGLITAVEAGTERRSGEAGGAIGLPGLPNLHSHAFQRGHGRLRRSRAARTTTISGLGARRCTASPARLTPDDVDGGGGPWPTSRCWSAASPASASSTICTTTGTVGPSPSRREMAEAHRRGGGDDRDRPYPAAGVLRPRRFRRRGAGPASAAIRHRPGKLRHACWRPAAAHSPACRTRSSASPRTACARRRRTNSRAILPLAGHGPIHIHVAEQVREVDDCLAWSGARPVDWLLDNAPVDARWCLVHATHMTAEETQRLATSRRGRRPLPDHRGQPRRRHFPARAFLAAGGRFGVGSDSNVRIDAAEELRLLEYGQRLAERKRNRLATPDRPSVGAALFTRALAGGAQALGIGGGRILHRKASERNPEGVDGAHGQSVSIGVAPGAPADIVSLNGDHPSLIARRGDALLDAFVFAAGREAIDRVWRGGAEVVAAGRRHGRDKVEVAYRAALARLAH